MGWFYLAWMVCTIICFRYSGYDGWVDGFIKGKRSLVFENERRTLILYGITMLTPLSILFVTLYVLMYFIIFILTVEIDINR